METNESLSRKIKQAFTQSDLIISRKVVEIKIVNKVRIQSSAAPIIYKFEISEITKTKFIEITSKASGASCGYKFELVKI